MYELVYICCTKFRCNEFIFNGTETCKIWFQWSWVLMDLIAYIFSFTTGKNCVVFTNYKENIHMWTKGKCFRIINVVDYYVFCNFLFLNKAPDVRLLKLNSRLFFSFFPFRIVLSFKFPNPLQKFISSDTRRRLILNGTWKVYKKSSIELSVNNLTKYNF